MNAGLARAAQAAADSAYRAVIALRVREHGSVNPDQLAAIKVEANAVADIERKAVYLRAGYTQCGCDALVHPDYASCFRCGAKRVSPVEPASPAKVQFVGESPFILPGDPRFAASLAK